MAGRVGMGGAWRRRYRDGGEEGMKERRKAGQARVEHGWKGGNG